MRNFDTELEDLRNDLEYLEIQKSDKETQLRQVITAQRESKTVKNPIVFKDRNGTVISVGDWVKAITPGKFKLNEGRVVGLKSWVPFEDINDVKKTRAPKNLVVYNHVRKRLARGRGTSTSAGKR